MNRITSQQHAPVAIVLRQQQVRAPGDDLANLQFTVKANQVAQQLDEIAVFRQRRMHREFFAIALRDDRRAIDKVVVPAFAHRNALVQVVRPEDHLARFEQSALALKIDVEPLAHRAGTTITTNQIRAAIVQRLPILHLPILHLRNNRHALLVLLQIDHTLTVAHCDVRRLLGHALKKWLNLVL